MPADYRTLPPIDRSGIARDLQTLGLRGGDTVLVHSAMSRIGRVAGGAPAVVDASLDVLGPAGTLAVPTFPFTGSMLAHVRSDPDFDVDFRNSTLLHTAEEIARVPFIDFETRYRLRGRTRRAAYAMSIYCHSTPLKANFPVIEPVLLERGLLTTGKVGSAECRLAPAKVILDVALERLAVHPTFLRAG